MSRSLGAHIPLSDWHKDRLMVGRTCHGADTVVSSRQATSDRRRQLALAVASIVDTLEESKLGRIRRRGGILRATHVLNGNVRVADDVATGAELLGRGVVRAVRVGEGAQLHIGDLNGDVEVLVRRGRVVGERVDDDGRDHVRRGGHLAHRDTVAGTLLLLQTVGQCLTHTKVDKVGVVGLRFGLASLGALGTVLLRAGLEGLRVQSKRGIVCDS